MSVNTTTRADAAGLSGDPLARAWGLLLQQSDTVADGITLAVLERDSHLYDSRGPELRGDMRHTIRRVVRLALMILSGQGERVEESPKELWRETGRRRARQGVPLELVMHAFASGSRVLWEALVSRAVGEEGLVDDAVLIDAGRRLWADLDVINAVVIDAYRREFTRLQRRDQQREQGVLDALLEGRGGDPAFAAESRSLLGIGADDPVACVVALLDDSTDEGFGVVEDRLDRHGVQARWHVRSGAYFGLLWGALPDEDGIVALFGTGPPGRVGVARSSDGVGGFAAAHLLATRAAETLPAGAREAVSVGSRLPQVLLAGSPQVAPLLAEALAGLHTLPAAHADTLLDTLAALLRHDGSPTHAAAELYCHRNTVIYRLKQIEELTGRSLASPADKMLLSLALLATGRT
jgi:hypothetical protein